MKTASLFLFFLLIGFDSMAQIKPYNLIAAQRTGSVYLINQDGDIAHSWELSELTATSAYLLPDGQLVRTLRVNNPPFSAGGSTGGVERADWNGQVLWRYEIAGERFHAHHDIAVLPNGNILVMSWERLRAEEALAAGRTPTSIPVDGVWSEVIFELKPVGQSDAEIVWQWHLADHLVQDIDESKENFGVVADHAERVNFNYIKNADNPDWVHANAIDYNKDLDQILFSAHSFNEFWIIDHSTTTEEAAGSGGGKSGKGGDLIYRWGNPRAYDRGSVEDQKLFNQHDVEWIPNLFPGEGRILLFNNGVGRPEGEYSTIDEVIPPINFEGQYELESSGRYGPSSTSPVYQAEVPESFSAAFLSGAQRLRGGNTLITDGPVGQVFEVTPEGETVWEYDSFVISSVSQQIFRIDRYYLSALPPTGMVLDESISGNWYDPERDSEGYVIEVLDDGRILLIWLTYPPQSTATDLQAWMIGVGYLEGDHIVVNRMQTLKGSAFGSDFDSAELQKEEWGRIEMVFNGCDTGETRYSGPPEYGEGVLNMRRLTRLHGLNCPLNSVESEVAMDSVEPSLASEAANGSFYQPLRDGEGWFLEYLGNGRALVQWFTYNLDGNQARLTGVGQVDGARVLVDEMIYVTGTEFGVNFDPDDVSVQVWGTLEIEFDHCDKGRIRYSSQLPGWGSGETEVIRLTSVSGVTCDWPDPQAPP